MRLLYLVALSFLVLSAQVCNGRPQADEDVTATARNQLDLITTESIQDAGNEKVTKVTVADALKDISKSLKQNFIHLGDKIREKLNELKQAAGDQVQKIKEQLKCLKQQLKVSAQALAQKVKAFFNKGEYASLGQDAVEIFGKVVEIRDRLMEFAKDVKEITLDKVRKMQEMAKQLRKEIKMQVEELIGGFSDSQEETVQARHVDDEEGNEANVITTLKAISNSLKERLLTLIEQLKQKFAKLKRAGAEQVDKIKREIYVLKGRMADAREALKQKVRELFRPTQYTLFGEHATEIFAKLGKLREKLVVFLKAVKEITGEKLEKIRELLKETRQEIKQRIQDLAGSESAKTGLYQVDDTDEDSGANIVETLKKISKSLKEKFLALWEKIAEKVREIEESDGERAAVLKKQLNELKEQLGVAVSGLKKKVHEMTRPDQTAQYGVLDHLSSAVTESLSTLRSRLQKFLENVKHLVGEKWITVGEMIHELRNEIKQSIQKLLHGNTERKTTISLEPTSALPLQY